MLPARFEQATICLVVIDNSKLMRPAVCLGEECGLICRTAAGNGVYLNRGQTQVSGPGLEDMPLSPE